MKAEVIFEYVLELCLDNKPCDVFNISIPDNFILESIELDARVCSLSHLCSCRVMIDRETLYAGPIGKDGFVMEIDTILPIHSIRITTNCGSLFEWVSEIEPCVIKVHGYYVMAAEKPVFNETFSDVWG